MRSIICLALLTAITVISCGSNSINTKNQYSVNFDASKSTLKVCRLSSINRIDKNLSLYVNDEIVAKVSNGSTNSIAVAPGDKIRLGSDTDLLMGQMSDWTVYEQTVSNHEDLFLVVRGKGLGMFSGGVHGKENWSVIQMSQSEYAANCKYSAKSVS